MGYLSPFSVQRGKQWDWRLIHTRLQGLQARGPRAGIPALVAQEVDELINQSALSTLKFLLPSVLNPQS